MHFDEDGEGDTLEARLIADISNGRPLRLDEYMRRCLYIPPYGYYRRGIPLGAEGDFITSPEISQMFGELLGLWLYERWAMMQAPAAFTLLEAGPGRGTLLADALRAIAQMRQGAQFISAAQIHLLEINRDLRPMQQAALEPYAVTFIDRLGAVPLQPLLVVANEFLDCLPIRAFGRVKGRASNTPADFEELAVGVVEGVLSYVRMRVDDELPVPLEDVAAEYVEISEDAEHFVRSISELIAQYRGAALLIDYGYDTYPAGPSLQAVQRHEKLSPFAAPGLSDLTALVNFPALVRVAKQAGMRVSGPVGQGRFLSQMGIDVRARQLQSQHPEQAEKVQLALSRLCKPSEMGRLFRVIALTEPQSPEPSGFLNDD